MANPLWLDIQAQGDNLRHVVHHLYGPERKRLKEAARFLGNDKPILFIGMGSAAYLCMPAEFYLGRHGRLANVVYASEALYTLLPVLQHVNVVINSRSGETAEVVKLSHALLEAKIPFLAITNEPESTLAQGATHLLWSRSRKDDLVSINIVTGMMAATLILTAEAVGQSETTRSAWDDLASALDDTLVRAVQQADELAGFLEAIRPIYLLYRGPSKGSAYCGRLVLEEVGRRPALPSEAADFRQGTIEVVDDRFGAIVFIPEGKPGQLNLALADDIRASGGRVLMVGAAETGDDSKKKVFHVAAAPSDFRPILEVVPVQMLAYKLAERQGLEPGAVRFLSKVITTELGIPRLSQSH
jgi:glucosamine--fructose-6-phosphate aminotransferase (isomerizing)